MYLDHLNTVSADLDRGIGAVVETETDEYASLQDQSHLCIRIYSVHVELALLTVLIHFVISGCSPCTIDYSRGFWYGL